MIGGTLFRRLFIRIAIGLGLAALVFTALVHVFQSRVVDRVWREELQQEAEWMVRHTAASAGVMMATAWRAMHSAVRITFYDIESEMLADSHPERAPIDLVSLGVGAGTQGQLMATAQLAGGGILVMSRPYVPAFLSGMWWELGGAILLILGPMVLLLYPPVRSIGLSLREMGGMAREVSAGRFGMTLPVSRSDELGTLVQAFNQMSERLAEAERLNSRLLHDVSHELRSPLGRIQVLADMIEQRPAERAACIRGIELDVALLDRLVGDLLLAARRGRSRATRASPCITGRRRS
ncbi:MAG: signal transduction histidine kinase [Chlamydiales bacterium]|jgi:signal transduction histidine kinase